jgi:hypothetical protein
MTQSLTLSAKGVSDIKHHELFKFFISQEWGYITNLDIKGDIAYINIINWEDKFPEDEPLSLHYKDKVLQINKLNWTPRKKWKPEQFSVLTSFIECGR